MPISDYDTGDIVSIKHKGGHSYARIIAPCFNWKDDNFYYFLEDIDGNKTLENKQLGKAFPEHALSLVQRHPGNEEEYKLIDKMQKALSRKIVSNRSKRF